MVESVTGEMYGVDVVGCSEFALLVDESHERIQSPRTSTVSAISN